MFAKFNKLNRSSYIPLVLENAAAHAVRELVNGCAVCFLLSDCVSRAPPHRGRMTYWLKRLIYSDEASGEAPGLVLVTKSTPSPLALAPQQTHGATAAPKNFLPRYSVEHIQRKIFCLSIPHRAAADVPSRQAHQADFRARTESDLITAAMQNEYHSEFETSKDSVLS